MHVCVCIYVGIYVCLYVSIHVCTHTQLELKWTYLLNKWGNQVPERREVLTKAKRQVRSLSGGSADPQCQALPSVNPAPTIYVGTWPQLPAINSLIPNPGPWCCPLPGSEATSPQTHTHANRLHQRTPNPAMPQGNSRTVWAHLPPHHSEGQPHGPGVVNDVSSHLGLQEGALS